MKKALSTIATLLLSGILYAGTVTLAWDPSPSPGIASYKVYWGISNRFYTNSVSAGSATTLTVSNLASSATYYFAATAMDTNGVESDFSGEAIRGPIVPPLTYGLLFIQGSTNGTTFYDLSSTPYLRLTNGLGGPLGWQWFRSRTEMTTNWR